MIREQLWRILADSDAAESERVRAAYLLANYDRWNPRWLELAREASLLLTKIEPTYLVMEPSYYLNGTPNFQSRFPLRDPLGDRLWEIIQDSNRQMSARVSAMLMWGYVDIPEFVENRGPEGVLAVCDQAIATLESLLPKNASGRAVYLLLELHCRRAEALTRLNRQGDALKDWMRAAELIESPRIFYSSILKRAIVFAHAKDHVRATAEANSYAAQKFANADTLYDAACVFVLCTLAVPDDPAQKQAYTNRALDLLRRAISSGYKNVEHLKKDSDLDPLRSHPNFQKLLREVQEKSNHQTKKPGRAAN
jgi:hypothetical protein